MVFTNQKLLLKRIDVTSMYSSTKENLPNVCESPTPHQRQLASSTPAFEIVPSGNEHRRWNEYIEASDKGVRCNESPLSWCVALAGNNVTM